MHIQRAILPAVDMGKYEHDRGLLSNTMTKESKQMFQKGASVTELFEYSNV